VNHLYLKGGSTNVLPADTWAATVVEQRTHACLIAFGLPADIPTTNRHQSFMQMLDALPPSLKWATHEYALPPDLEPLVASITAGTAQAVSDGSFKYKFGSLAFTILNSTDTSIIGLNIVPLMT
jgi:hypothetical protein